eukprot:TRINITY_DN27742_c0_g1_i1.p1 TRINITY_DN27742_c0_g1~~TRINITY_DN27742_c0_g1_i1.p1  ORF type:complete len:199 (+),score=30.88 TRINITY_DN27742_c0_g1_i1:188-784(+)
MARLGRLRKELAMLQAQPPPGIIAWPHEDNLSTFRAQIIGPDGSPFKGISFEVELIIGQKYPFEPPKARFLTPIYHPNVDKSGRICLDLLKMPPKGSWKPSLNLSSLLLSLRVLMGEANPDDGLMPDISAKYKSDREAYNRIARQEALETTKSSSGLQEAPKPSLKEKNAVSGRPIGAKRPVSTTTTITSKQSKLQSQ